MFRTLAKSASVEVGLTINGQYYRVPAGCSVWTAMILAHETTTRLSPVTKKKRSAYCAMGVCYECLVEIDGTPNQQACLKEVKEGMQICRQEITESTIAELDSLSSEGLAINAMEAK
ncbi:sarcosine oxidase [Endozoicomonas sp. OPT23]|uniref:(2Fe-2S)-binding protein n=1 Tax=Endozoicomonas sp. OPT23 TaxID=2072845 RepID=UPI00129B88EB|nr:(2Fe-2S)-binding protein [Endozoicomonas sp. OPT23]MRI33853.1 sarcosine oxidase [Endozoicomonas sp. OPT23]